MLFQKRPTFPSTACLASPRPYVNKNFTKEGVFLAIACRI
jgi:hypothetical protein